MSSVEVPRLRRGQVQARLRLRPGTAGRGCERSAWRCETGTEEMLKHALWVRPHTVKILDRNPHYFMRIFAYAPTDMNSCRIRHVCLEAQIIAH